MDHRSQFKECKKRNEQQLLDIRKLEARIARVKQQIETKKKAKLDSQQKQSQNSQIIRHHQLLRKLLTNEIQGRNSAVETRPSFTGKHDLTQLLATTPDLVFKKIELLIQQRIATNESFNSQEPEHINHLIARLPADQVGQFVSSVLQQLKSEIQTIQVPGEKQLYAFQQNIEDQQKVIEYHSSQKQRAKELAQRKDQLELATREAEVRLVRRVRELYADPAVQSALVKNIRVKAANHQVNVELQSTIQGANDINRRIQVAQRTSNLEDIGSQIEKLKKAITQKQNEVQSLIHANNEFYDTRKNQTVEAKDTRGNDHQVLIDRIKAATMNAVQDMETDSSLGPVANVADQSDALLLDIKNAISPHSLISGTRAITEIINIINSANELSKDSVVDICSDIRSTLESLVDKWGSSLERQNIPITEGIPEYHDGIDNVIETVDALREHIMENEQVYIVEQEERLKAKLALADKVDQEIKRAQDSLEERELITQIGVDYTIQDKSFNEWLQKLLVKDE